MATYPTTITVAGIDPLVFIAGRIDPDGHVPEEPIDELEQLECDGVNYARYRSRGLRFPRFQLHTLAVASAQTELDTLCARHWRCQGQLLTLTHTVRNRVRTWKKIYASEVRPAQLPGSVIASLPGVGSLGLRTVWTLELTEKQ